MDLRSIEAFIRVADLGSITAASRDLNIVQPALSRHIQRIESELGVPLLVRLPRGVQLTIAGRRFLEHARRILQEVARATDDVAAGSDACSGEVSVGLSPTLSTLLVPGLAESTSAAHPRVKLRIAEAFSRHLQSDVADGRLDVALLTNPPQARGLRLTPVFTEPVVVVMPMQSRGAVPVITADEIARLPVILTRGIRTFVEEQLASHGVSLSVEMEVDSVEAIRKLLLERFAAASLMPISAFREDIDAGRLLAVPVGGINLSRTIVMAHLVGEMTPAVAAVSGLLRAEIERLAERGVFSVGGEQPFSVRPFRFHA
ncbi:LysR family transcriptional regulator [Bosea sp. (in: a-proteobacteria)]|jgi:LysR family nitrogen assimilation transcriptional regulator|uniref:LysR family transcriptional regulator n=1 Tax=Bosea sp. (in: a-proteobacteria) TaxID=1871050 RepID=UPI003F70B72B